MTGNLNPYVTDYYKQFDKGMGDSQTYLLGPVLSFVTTLFVPIGGFVAKKVCPRK